ncbi:SMP-30/gluconolactonase/LRE family protein [Caballeronia sp. INDeC2]|uniref:SMP-30/gluconolactonase/LRE family protein n=1 Tax=Caballeronia sp. INDeC2 TaxID=2921747 RepID=UPI002027C852|nr:SMP-30/gluconolactonase/LRE family protein [Caballeronia sp. INDeC2]
MKTPYHESVTPIKRELIECDKDFAFYQYRVDNSVGECPTWDHPTQTLLWIDVRGAELLLLDKQGMRLTKWLMPKIIGAACRTESGEILLALKDEVRVFDTRLSVSRYIAAPEPDRKGNRLNEGRVSPCGNWFLFGSMDDSGARARTGAIYAMDRNGGINRIHDGLFIANGFSFTPDGHGFKFSDSFLGVAFQSKWDPLTGTISEIREWFRSGEEQGRPDGAMIDLSGNYWSAGVSAGRINVFDGRGVLIKKIAMPCHAPTMVCGARTGTLFVTSLVRAEWPKNFINRHDGQLIELEAHKGVAVDYPPRFNLS